MQDQGIDWGDLNFTNVKIRKLKADFLKGIGLFVKLSAPILFCMVRGLFLRPFADECSLPVKSGDQIIANELVLRNRVTAL